jgi:VanZ family protein
MPFAAGLAVASTFLIGCLDEWHQRYLRGRVGSIRDALLDSAGALFINLIVWAVVARRRRKVLSGLQLAREA